MRTPGYRPDDIRKAMGFAAFFDDDIRASTKPVVRLLLTPSFDPEVCVTMLPTADDDAVLDVRTFDVQLWAQLSTGRRPNVLTATANVSRGVYERFATQLYRCAQEPAQKQGIAVLDGMGTHALCWCENAEYTIGGNSARGSKAYSQFLREFVEVVRRRLPASQCRSAIATTKRYL